MGRLLLLLVLVPVIEVILLVKIASVTSVPFVLGLVLGMAVLGSWLARHQGLRVLQRISTEIEQRRLPGDALVDGCLVFLAAVLLIIPGVLTDVVALLLLWPPSRRVVKHWARRRLAGQIQVVNFSSGGFGMRSDFAASDSFGNGGRDEIIDVRVLDSPPRNLPN